MLTQDGSISLQYILKKTECTKEQAVYIFGMFPMHVKILRKARKTAKKLLKLRNTVLKLQSEADDLFRGFYNNFTPRQISTYLQLCEDFKTHQ